MQQKDKDRNGASTPVSISLKNTFVIANSGESFDNYYNQKKKKGLNQSFHGGVNTSYLSQNTAGSGGGGMRYGLMKGKQPTARDGHSVIYYKKTMFVFGGDRHHMPFNDFYVMQFKE